MSTNIDIQHHNPGGHSDERFRGDDDWRAILCVGGNPSIAGE